MSCMTRNIHASLKLYLGYVPAFTYKNLPVLFALLAVFLLILKFKVLTLILVLLTLDIANSYVNFIYKISIPVDFFLMMIILLSYHNQVWLAMMISPLVLLSRGILGKLEFRHVYKIPILIVTAILTSLFSFIDILACGVLVIGIRYLLEYVLQVTLLGGVQSVRFIQRALNYVGGYGFLALFGRIILAFLG